MLYYCDKKVVTIGIDPNFGAAILAGQIFRSDRKLRLSLEVSGGQSTMSELESDKPVENLMEEIQAHFATVKSESEIDKLVSGLLEQIQAHLEKAKNEQRSIDPSDIDLLSASLERLHNIRLTREGANLQRKIMKKFENFGPFNLPPNT